MSAAVHVQDAHGLIDFLGLMGESAQAAETLVA